MASRRSCQKCRFLKCIAVGMTAAWVLSEEQCTIRSNKYNRSFSFKQLNFYFVTGLARTQENVDERDEQVRPVAAILQSRRKIRTTDICLNNTRRKGWSPHFGASESLFITILVFITTLIFITKTKCDPCYLASM